MIFLALLACVAFVQDVDDLEKEYSAYRMALFAEDRQAILAGAARAPALFAAWGEHLSTEEAATPEEVQDLDLRVDGLLEYALNAEILSRSSWASESELDGPAMLAWARAYAADYGGEEWSGRLARMHARLAYDLQHHAYAAELWPAALASLSRDDVERADLAAKSATTLRRLSRHVEAIDTLNVAETDLALADANASRVQAAWVGLHSVRGQVWTNLGLLDKAASELMLAEEWAGVYFETTGDPGRLHIAVIALVDLYLMTKAYDEILAKVDALLADERLGARNRALLQTQRGLALAALEQRDPAREPQAREALEAVLAIDGLADAPAHSARVGLIEIAIAGGEYARAEELLVLAGERNKTAGTRAPATNRAFLRGLWIQLALARGDGPEVLRRELERGRASFAALLDEWSRAPSRPGGVGFFQITARRTAWSELARACVALPEEGARSALALLLEAQTRGSLARRLELPVPTPELVERELLDEGTGLLVFLPTVKRTHVFAWDAAGIAHELIAREDELKAAQAAVRKHLTRAHSGPLGDALESYRNDGRVLSKMLFPDSILARVRGWQHVHVIGADLLGDLHLETLELPGGGTLEDFATVDYPPSIPFALWLARPGVETDDTPMFDATFVVAPSPSHAARERWPKLAPLPVTSEDLARLQSPFAAMQSRLLSGDGATPEAVCALSPTRALTLIAHGVRDVSAGRPARIALRGDGAAADGLLTCEDVERGISAEVVLLASCGAARGPQRFGDEATGNLGGAFLFGGARSVVLCGADLRYDVALEFAARMNAGYARGLSASAALREARAEVAAMPGFEHPASHALLRVMGLGNRPVMSARPRTHGGIPWIPALGAAALLAAAGLAAAAIRRKRRVA